MYSAMLLALANTSEALAASLKASSTLVAQAPTPTSFPLPSSVPSGSSLTVDGSSSMTLINEALKQRFEQKFAGTAVELSNAGTAAALESLVKGDIDLAAIGRPLTAAEKAEGLVAVPISREKIAIIVGPDNPYAGSLTFEQFAKIFRGEITNWSEVGGEPGNIRFVDRPDTSDTRLSLGTYKIFQDAPFETGATATQVGDDETATVVNELGNDGISYAIADQVIGQSNVKIVPMHKTLPDNPAYPYSQPRSYVYKAGTEGTPRPLTPIVQAFLGFATSAPGQEAVETAKAAEAAAVATATATPSSTDPSTASDPSTLAEASPSSGAAAVPAAVPQPGLPWWGILLPLLGLAGLLLWLKGRGAPSVAAVAPPPGVAPGVPVGAAGGAVAAGTAALAGAAFAAGQDDEAEAEPQPVDEVATPVVEDGVTSDEQSNSGSTFGLPSLEDIGGNIGAAGAVAAGTAALAGAAFAADQDDEAEAEPQPVDEVAVPTVEDSIPSDEQSASGSTFGLPSLEDIGGSVGTAGAVAAGTAALAGAAFAAGQDDEAEAEPQPVDEPDLLEEDAWDTPAPAVVPSADVSASEVSISQEAEQLDSEELKSPDGEGPDASGLGVEGLGAAGLVAAGLAAGLGGAAIAEMGAPVSDSTVSKSSILFSKWGTTAGYVKWDLPEGHKAACREQGGRNLKLRIYDATALDLDTQDAHSVDEYDINGWMNDHDKIVPIHQGDRDYVAEVGYTTDDGRWLRLARSQHVHFPAKVVAQKAVATHPAAASGALFEGYPLTKDSVITDLVVHSRRNAFLLSPEEMQHIQNNVAAKTYLAAGIYEIKITDGTFDYQAQTGESGEPLAILWIYGGKVINQATNVPVMATWSTLNGYGDVLTLEVLDSVTVCAFFIDTYLDDNEGGVHVSVEKIYRAEILATQD